MADRASVADNLAMSVVRPVFLASVLTSSLLAAAAPGCAQREVESEGSYFDRKIGPILAGSCARSPTGSLCHVTADERGNALGNLDVTSYDMIAKRQDLFANYGPYGMPALLLKAVPPQSLTLTAYDDTSTTISTAIPHTGNSILDPGAASFQTLLRWLERGANENNSKTEQKKIEKEACVERIGKDPLFDPTKDPTTPDYQQFVNDVNPFLVENCAGANCHGASEGSFPLSCGNTDEQVRWNYFSATDYVSKTAQFSEILQRPMNPAYGGTYHEGGSFFDSPDDGQYQKMLAWAQAQGGATNIPSDPGFAMFAKRVQPMLVKRGCILVGCHSAPAFNDFKPRASSGTHFGLSATRDNYRQVLKQVALESPDPNSGRLIRKNLEPSRGIRHRGGALFALGGDPTKCDLTAAETGPLDAQEPYCVIVAWIAKERAERMKTVAPLSGIVYVKRPPSSKPDALQDFESYAPGADLRFIGASLDAQGKISTSGGDTSLLGGCGLTVATADVRRPQVSWDGKTVAFAARTSATAPLKVYTVKPDGSGCAVEPTIDAAPKDESGGAVPTNGELIHNFDPAFAPDGTLVFASTRGNILKNADFKGPLRSAADPSKLNSNLYVLENGKIRQLTFLLNYEGQPSFKLNGQMLMTSEKRAPGFYQLAARRINLDGGDYHPQFGQRSSMGYLQFTDCVALPDGNFAGIASDRGAANQAGTLLVINRSIGPDNASGKPEDYLEDPDAIDYAKTPFFQRSIKQLDPAATGRVGSATKGAYRNPSALPNSDILVSYAANVIDTGKFSGNFDVVVMDSITGQRTSLFGDAGSDELWPVAVFGRVNKKVFRSTPADPTGSAVIYSDDADRNDRAQLTYLDFPMITSLAFQNTRSRRFIHDMESFELWESLPPQGEKSLNDASPYIIDDGVFGKLYARRRLRGSVPLKSDGSTRLQIPGGIPVIVGVQSQLQGESDSTMHHQKEEVQYYPGEWVTLSFRRELFNNFCGGCHGPTTGKETDVATKPDLLSQASKAESKNMDPIDLVSKSPGEAKAPPFP